LLFKASLRVLREALRKIGILLLITTHTLTTAPNQYKFSAVQIPPGPPLTCVPP